MSIKVQQNRSKEYDDRYFPSTIYNCQFYYLNKNIFLLHEDVGVYISTKIVLEIIIGLNYT